MRPLEHEEAVGDEVSAGALTTNSSFMALRRTDAALPTYIVFTSSMVSKVLALAVIVAAVGAVAVETPLAGKSESGIESPAARSAE